MICRVYVLFLSFARFQNRSDVQSRKQAFECVFAKRKSEVSLPVVFLWPDPGGSVAVRVVTTLRTRALLLTFQYIQDRSEKPVTGILLSIES